MGDVPIRLVVVKPATSLMTIFQLVCVTGGQVSPVIDLRLITMYVH